ncbi:hypothetical protein A8B79_00785 [Balneola sp. EhC07]|uniref:hypothetical protein n=1 Tax=Balneola sp. EhC07 TaxID=1849360 RepID=UPI0007F4E146|nr:hypothetical protein [Balneola sp. EhC07]MBO6571640.1 hypothetical protein [Balneola sp.]OAN64712.1 hypothetical protein A8B79_00785 [Balneola sp. EhC07]
MIELEKQGKKHLVVSVNKNLGNKMSYSDFCADENYVKSSDIIISKIDSLADNGYEVVRRQKCYSVAQGHTNLLYIKEGSKVIRIPFTIEEICDHSVIILTHVFVKDKKNKENLEFKSADKIITNTLKWISENEKKFQKLIK